MVDVRCRFWNPHGGSQADAFRARGDVAALLSELSKKELLSLRHAWDFWARPKQKPPPLTEGDSPIWRYWVVLAGRMFGKSTLAAQWIRGKVERGEARRIVLAGPRYKDVERVQIANLKAAFPPGRRPRYNRDAYRLHFWPYTEEAPYADICSGEVVDSFRGPEWDCGWLDEFAAFRYLDDVWTVLLPAMRAIPPRGGVPQLVCTTTPRNKRVLHELLENPAAVITQGASRENQHNVASGVLDAVRFVYGSSDLAEQELEGKLLGNEPGALFKQEWFAANRVVNPPRFKKKYLVVDTSGSGSSSACECGIMLFGLEESGQRVYLLGDYSLRATPEEWAKRLYQVYREQGAEEIVYECHYGGELVPTLFKLLNLKAKFKPVAAVGDKAERAQPVRALVQNGRVKLVGVFKEAELQCCTWTPEDKWSPDRLDAFVHGVTYAFPVINVARGTIEIPGIY